MGVIVSVILPVTGSEEELVLSINSLAKQQYKDIDIVLVDSGQFPELRTVYSEYAAKDVRFKAVFSDAHTVSDLRNAGLSEIKGEYFLPLIAGDSLMPDMIEKLMRLCLENSAEIAECAVETKGQPPLHLTNKTTIYNTPQVFEAMVKETAFSSFGCNKLYKCSLSKKIHWTTGKMMADEFTTHRFYAAATKCVFLDTPLYARNFSDRGISENQEENAEYCDALRRRMRLIWTRNFQDAQLGMNNYYARTVFDSLYKCCEQGLFQQCMEEVMEKALDDWQQIKWEKLAISRRYNMIFVELAKGLEYFSEAWRTVQVIYGKELQTVFG